MNLLISAVLFELAAIILLDVVIFKLRRELRSARKSAKDSEGRAERHYERAEKLQAILDGNRVPSQYCEGCRNLIKQRAYPMEYVYGCRKNIRCKEYEGDARCS